MLTPINQKTTIFFLLILFNTIIFAQKTPELILPVGQVSNITDIKLSPDGKYFATSDKRSVFKLWETATGREIRTFTARTGSVNTIAFHPDGKRIFSGNGDKSIRVWNIQTGEEIKVINYHSCGVKCLIVSNNGKYLISKAGIRGRMVAIWDTETYKRIFSFVSGEDSDPVLALSPDNNRLAFSTGIFSGRNLKVYDLKSKKEICTLNKKKISAYAMAFNNNGDVLATGDTELRLWNPETGELIKKSKYLSEAIYSLQYDKSNKYILTHDKKQIKIWDANTLEIIKKVDCIPDKEQKLNRKAKAIYSIDDKFILSYQKTSVYYRNTESMKITKILNAKTRKTYRLAISSDSKKIYTVSGYRGKEFTIREWDLEQGMQTKIFEAHDKPLTNIVITPDNKNLITQAAYYTHMRTAVDSFDIDLWDIKTGKKTKKIGCTDNNVISMSPNGKSLAIGSLERIFYTKNIYSGEKEVEFDPKYGAPNPGYLSNGSGPKKIVFSSDGKSLISCSWTDRIKLWSTETGEIISKLYGHLKTVTDVDYSSDGKRIVSTSKDGTVRLWDVKTGKQLFSFTNHEEQQVHYCAFSPDGKYVLSSGNFISKLWSTKTKKEIFSITQAKIISSIKFTPDGKFIIIGTANGLLKLYDSNTGKEVVKLVSFAYNDEWIAITPDRYFFASKKATTMLHYVLDNKIYGFDQFDLQYNRPDIILKRLGYASDERIRLYYKAYLKRLKRTGFNDKMFNNEWHIPEIEIENKYSIHQTTKNGEIKLEITASDTKYKLKMMNVWVNSIPIYGAEGIDLMKKNSYKISKKIKILLSQGENKIEVSVTNEKGAESYKESIFINYEPKNKTKPDLYFLAVGVSNHKDASINLNYAAKDAGDLTKLFKKNKTLYNKIKILPYFDDKATSKNILNAKNILNQTKIDDVVIVFFAGHGFLDENLDYYLITHDVDVNDISGTALKYEDFEAILNGIPARKKVLLMDACHSGEVDKHSKIEDETELYADNRGVVKYISKTRNVLENKSNLGMQNSFTLMKEMFNDLRKGSGTTVISSAGGGEYAYEGQMMKNGKIEKIKNGVFTYSVLDALQNKKADIDKNGKITISELKNYVFDRVSKLTIGHQNPTFRKEVPDLDFEIW